MYSEYFVEVQMDYPAGVALRLNRKRVAFESLVAKRVESEASRFRVAEAKVWSPLRVANRVAEAKVYELLASCWQDPGNETIQGSLADHVEAKI